MRLRSLLLNSSKTNTYAVVQARMGSTRLPGKVMKIVAGKPMLELMIERLKRAKELDGIVIATTDKTSEQPIVDLVNSLDGILLFRGSEDNVLARYYGAAVEYGAETIVRVTSDCPLIDPDVIDKVVRVYREKKNRFDYVANIQKRTYPRGLDTEVFSFKALEKAYKEAVLKPDREHVTEYILQRPEMFRMLEVADTVDNSSFRWTVDTKEDLELITKIYDALYCVNPDFRYTDILKLFEKYPEWKKINAHIEQKLYGQ